MCPRPGATRRRTIAAAARASPLSNRHFRDEGRAFAPRYDELVGAVAREAYSDAWGAFQEWIFRYAGSSAGTRGAKLERVLHDMAIGWSHFNTAQNDFSYAEVAKARLGLPNSPLF